MKPINTLFSFLLLATFVCVLTGSGCQRTEGCTNPEADNYDPTAEKNDGSCIFINRITVSDVDGNGVGEDVVWTADNEYLLDGLVYVNEGQTLTIEAGTVIKGKLGQGSNAAALIVARGGTINAVGTSNDPIIFTSELDDVNDLDDMPVGTRGLWGGLVICGNATVNAPNGEAHIEGIAQTEDRGLYGGTKEDDTSGVLKYISIRHGGIDIGNFNELKGVTFAGVGSGTVVEHIEVFYNKDDGFSFEGGTVNAKWLCAAYCQDDGFDTDLGYRGKCQFMFSIMEESKGDYGGEHDGADEPVTATPFAHSEFYNCTMVGLGQDLAWGAVVFKENAGGEYHNSIFVDYPVGAFINMTTDDEDCWDRYNDGDIALEGNIFWNVGGNEPDSIFRIFAGDGVMPADVDAASAELRDYFSDVGNTVEDPGISVSRWPNGGLDVTPSGAGATGGATPSSDSWFEGATYKGAFSPNENWLSGWSGLSQHGYFAE
ncbi:MAG: hypothetical protein AAF570_02460 [Bacteroidota bacterium]